MQITRCQFCAAITLSAALIPFSLSGHSASSQTISTVKIVVPVPPGGATDFVARLLAEQIGRAQGIAFTSENRSGAGGIIGAEAASRAAPDGSTLLIHSNSFLIDPLVQRTNYYPLTSFEPICIWSMCRLWSPSTQPHPILGWPTSLRRHAPNNLPDGSSAALRTLEIKQKLVAQALLPIGVRRIRPRHPQRQTSRQSETGRSASGQAAKNSKRGETGRQCHRKLPIVDRCGLFSLGPPTEVAMLARQAVTRLDN